MYFKNLAKLSLVLAFTLVISTAIGQEQGVREVTIGAEEICRIQFIILPSQIDRPPIDLLPGGAGSLLGTALFYTRDTTDIVMFKGEGEEIEQGEGKKKSFRDVESEFLSKIMEALNRFGGVILSFGAYTHEIYIGDVTTPQGRLELLLPASGDPSFRREEIDLADVATVALTGCWAEIILWDGSQGPSGILISPLKVSLARHGAITGKILNDKFQLEVTDPGMCEGSLLCEKTPEEIFIIDFGEERDRILLKAGERPGEEAPAEVTEPGEFIPSREGEGAIIPSIEFTPEAPSVNEPVQFSYPKTLDDGEKIISWEWDFDDGTKSSEQNPIHTFKASRIYNVCVTITTETGKEFTPCKLIDVWLTGKLVHQGLVLETIGRRQVIISPEEIDWVLMHHHVVPVFGTPKGITSY